MRRFLLSGALASALLAVGPGAPVAAGQLVDLATEAEAAAAAGNHGEAFELLRSALIRQWDASPLGFRVVTFVAGDPGGFGIYDPREDNVFEAGETLHIYAEPIGFRWQDNDGIQRALMTADLMLRTAGGEIIAGQKEFGRFGFNSREHNTELMTHLSVDFTGAPEGDYVAEVIYRDQVSGSVASFELPFSIR